MPVSVPPDLWPVGTDMLLRLTVTDRATGLAVNNATGSVAIYDSHDDEAEEVVGPVALVHEGGTDGSYQAQVPTYELTPGTIYNARVKVDAPFRYELRIDRRAAYMGAWPR